MGMIECAPPRGSHELVLMRRLSECLAVALLSARKWAPQYTRMRATRTPPAEPRAESSDRSVTSHLDLHTAHNPSRAVKAEARARLSVCLDPIDVSRLPL